jgi:hypothetical protein
VDNSVYLVWRYEGDFTLADMMAKKEFPYNMEPLLLGRWGAGACDFVQCAVCNAAQ